MKKQGREIKRKGDNEKMWNELRPVLYVCGIPFLVYFCVKFGTVAFFRAKQFINKEKTGDKSNEQKTKA